VVLSTLADGIVVLCCPDRTRFRPLKHAVRHLSEAGGHILGVVVNDVDFGRSGMFNRYDYNYHYSYRYKYGYRYGYGNNAAKPDAQTVETESGNAAAIASPDSADSAGHPPSQATPKPGVSNVSFDGDEE